MKRLYWITIKTSRNNRATRRLIDVGALLYYKIFRNNKRFIFRGKEYRYFYHLYNRTVASERVIEIPIAKALLDQYKRKDVLEVGNVMKHYFSLNHDVLDKYEEGKDVINKDVVSVNLKKKYDLILSVSTMEHVGYSYGESQDLEKFFGGISNLKRHLKKGGLLFVTFPLDYRQDLFERVRVNSMPFSREYYMRRTSFLNEWKQITKKQAIKQQGEYDGFYANANILYIAEFRK